MRVIRAILTTIMEVITAPFRLIGRIFGGAGARGGRARRGGRGGRRRRF